MEASVFYVEFYGIPKPPAIMCGQHASDAMTIVGPRNVRLSTIHGHECEECSSEGPRRETNH